MRDLEFYHTYEKIWSAIYLHVCVYVRVCLCIHTYSCGFTCGNSNSITHLKRCGVQEILRFDNRSLTMKDKGGGGLGAEGVDPQGVDPNFHFDNVLVFFLGICLKNCRLCVFGGWRFSRVVHVCVCVCMCVYVCKVSLNLSFRVRCVSYCFLICFALIFRPFLLNQSNCVSSHPAAPVFPPPSFSRRSEIVV